MVNNLKKEIPEAKMSAIQRRLNKKREDSGKVSKPKGKETPPVDSREKPKFKKTAY